MKTLTAAVAAALVGVAGVSLAQTAGGASSSKNPGGMSMSGSSAGRTPGAAALPKQCVGLTGDQRRQCIRQYADLSSMSGAGGTAGSGSTRGGSAGSR